MSVSKAATNIMTRKGQSSRWDYRHEIKEGAKKRRRREDKQATKLSKQNGY